MAEVELSSGLSDRCNLLGPHTHLDLEVKPMLMSRLFQVVALFCFLLAKVY
jgi:hypothetical protein